jgi:hypothetical protein
MFQPDYVNQLSTMLMTGEEELPTADDLEAMEDDHYDQNIANLL